MALRNTQLPAILFIICIWCGAISVSYGQANTDKKFQNQISASTINDNFLPPYQDYYFTNGLHLSYSRLVNSDFFLSNIMSGEQRKQILRFTLGQEIYTPRLIRAQTIANIDRPYAGYLFLTSTLDTFWRRQNYLQLGLTLGVIGPSAGGEQLQKKWHKWFGFPQPLGWQFQIQNLPVANINMDYKYSFPLSSSADIISNTGFRAGTAFNDLSAGAKLRLGDINAIDHSVATASQLQKKGKDTPADHHKKEWFVFLGVNNTFVLHNALIEGNTFDSTKQAYIKEAEPYLLTISGGFEYALPVVSWRLVMSQLSPEVKGGRRHNIVRVSMAVRF
ncbi:hypothetical protein LX73_2373 [Fodinibius salinus]|uniref:Lipid A deacylase LpxR family protein n=1 Tax=Fodinibius salinus TaxID=860790 RepID=A0A5D3YGI8_9BACT|nr:lipid A deacylase LpxR family protein [Fodinibius salinus]TYP92123.1 hypothetical protein LX73_2373 [Fodinibius salinus]